MKLRNILEKENEENFSPEEYINLYTCVPRRRLPFPDAPRFRRARSNRARTSQISSERIRRPILPPRHHPRLRHASHPFPLSLPLSTIYNMCTQKPPHDFSQQLYERYREAFNDYIEACVLPALREKKGEYMLKELVRRWDNHKIMVRWLSRFFNYLDRYYIQRHNLAQLKDVGMLCFRELVYTELKFSAKDAVLNLVEHERDGEQIDRALVKNILGIFVEMGMGGMEAYETDFEQNLLMTPLRFTRGGRTRGSRRTRAPSISSRRRSACDGRRNAWDTTCTPRPRPSC